MCSSVQKWSTAGGNTLVRGIDHRTDSLFCCDIYIYIRDMREDKRSPHVSEGNISFVCVVNGQEPLSHSWRACGEHRAVKG